MSGPTLRISGLTFAIRLRQALRMKGTSAAQFAREVNIEKSQFNKYVSGVKEPGFQVLKRIVENLPNVDARALIVGDNSDRNPG